MRGYIEYWNIHNHFTIQKKLHCHQTKRSFFSLEKQRDNICEIIWGPYIYTTGLVLWYLWYGDDGNGDDDDDGDKDEDDDSPLASVCEVLVFSDRSGVKILAANACWERKKTI